MMDWADVLNKGDEVTVLEFLEKNGQEVGENADSAGMTTVMTDEQMEMLKKQIVVFQILSDRLQQMYKDLSPGIRTGEMRCDPRPPLSSELKIAPRQQRWSPTPMQLQVLEGIFDEENEAPKKQKIREITSNLSKYGTISEGNVYNWFQNRRARCRRNQKKRRSTLPRRSSVSGDNNNDSDGSASTHKRSRTVVDTPNLCENPKNPRLTEDQTTHSEQICPELRFTDVNFDAAFAFLFSDDGDRVVSDFNPIVV